MCGFLQHTATRCNTLQHTSTYCHTLQHTATHYNILQRTAIHCNALQRTAIPIFCGVHFAFLLIATHCNTPHNTATHRNTLHHAASRCMTLQLAATLRNTLQHISYVCGTCHTCQWFKTLMQMGPVYTKQQFNIHQKSGGLGKKWQQKNWIKNSRTFKSEWPISAVKGSMGSQSHRFFFFIRSSLLSNGTTTFFWKNCIHANGWIYVLILCNMYW